MVVQQENGELHDDSCWDLGDDISNCHRMTCGVRLYRLYVRCDQNELVIPSLSMDNTTERRMGGPVAPTYRLSAPSHVSQRSCLAAIGLMEFLGGRKRQLSMNVDATLTLLGEAQAHLNGSFTLKF